MEEITLKNWAEYERWVEDIQSTRARLRESKENVGHISGLMFRGHSNHKWKLETSLERYFPGDMSVPTYARLADAIKPAVETLTDKRWNIPDYPTVAGMGRITFPHQSELFRGEAYEFLLFLRHNGFPSPILDWSTSPYVAAFFAYSGARHDAEYVSVHSFMEYVGRGKSASSSEPTIFEMGPYTRAHRRHFLQQGRYTVCIRTTADKTFFASHEDAFRKNYPDQDLVKKVNLPASERRSVLRRLDLHNINAYSLYASDEALMQSLAFRHIEDFIERTILTNPDDTPAAKA
jgi:hypothetical protein